MFPIEDCEAHSRWTAGGRQRWLREVQMEGGFRSWLLKGLELQGMEDRSYL